MPISLHFTLSIGSCMIAVHKVFEDTPARLEDYVECVGDTAKFALKY